MTRPRVHVGRAVPRTEDERLLTGRARFLADVVGPGTLHAAFVRSTYPHAELLDIDVAAARAHPGVTAVFVGADLSRRIGALATLHEPDPVFAAAFAFSMTDPRLPCLAASHVTYVGQPVAVVIAQSRRVAEDAAELVEVAYSPLPAVVDPIGALEPAAPLVHSHLGTNQAGSISCAFGDVQRGRRQARVVVEETYTMGRHGGVPLEGRGVVAKLDSRRHRVEVWTSTQIPHLVRRAICAATGWSVDEVRVVAPEVGGGFGTKANVYGEEVVIPVVARMLHRDVSWIEDRAEHLVSAAQGRDQVHHCRLSVDADGNILAWEDEFIVDIGAGSQWTAGILANTAIHLMGPYRLPAFRATGRAVYTTKTIVAQYRGAGRPEACFALERSLDHAARELGISPVNIRRRNLLGPDEMPYSRPLPYRDGVPITFDGGDYRRCLDASLDLLPESAVVDLARAHPNLLVGHGVAGYIEATGRGPYESARVTLRRGGTFEVAAGSASAGQGHQTTLSQVAADVLCVDLAEITVVNGDTDAVADGVGTFASRSAVLAGNAVRLAARRLVDRARELAARYLGVLPGSVTLSPEGFRGAGAASGLTWGDLAAALAPGGSLREHSPLEEVARYEPETVAWTMGVHAAVVGIDPETGLCTVLDYAVAHEGGTDINPMIVEGQIRGGVAQGIGGALLEGFHYDASGQPTSGTLADYLLPGTMDVPAVRVRHIHTDTAANPLGVRGVGESGTIAAYAAVASAADAALGSDHPRVTSTPIDPSVLVSRARQPAGATT